MNLNKLYNLQKKLDEKIAKNHNLISENLTSHKILALQVEVGELANETRCFKFWSLKEPSPKDIILEEFVDCLHFILSIGLDLNFDDITIDELSINNKNETLTKSFLEFFDSISLFKNVLLKENYIDMFSKFLYLGKQLDFSPKEIEKSYLHKNNINHQRQEEGY
ncbi:dUTP diphosphatase [Tepidibacter formicigenes]|jgi:dimeric dUTPase (all-alpha-NTP-PPase superfamily)|uniref:Dimeric dUTPase, all-alpha-NTP-PPase (MazG) superfamily n=1 Tax=Tepidibacter formicigenes DSM 15518 TaxID=1123349 RepID=A0A1M6MBA8_9FIRM|nr:dUTP diphosphatase [Tepidibacter formicigenes]SHJ80727.1 Dimeric dUTPase, all-alpha-NTP-PPase (MazG) superfamily [Tepidibacter formicigenes DSM 15518]